MKWSRVNEDSRNGIITRYTVHYEDVEKQDERTVDILAPATETIITGLKQKAKYLFKILAATSKGDGPYSNTTEEETEGNHNWQLKATSCHRRIELLQRPRI